MTTQTFQKEFLSLTIEEKRVVGDFIMKFFLYQQEEPHIDDEILKAQKAEIEHRMKLIEEGKMKSYTLEEFKQKSQETLIACRNGKI